MKYPLEALLGVRKFREDGAANEVTRCRRAVEEARELVEQRKRELQEYTEWRVKREAELYAEIMDQAIHVGELDDLKLKIQMLRDKELTLEDRIKEAERGVEAAQENLEKSIAQHRIAVRDREKIDEHKELWNQDQAKAAEAAAELEMEDFRVRSPDAEF